MAKSLNKCQFIGNLGQDPEIKYLPNGDAVCNLSIACNESWKDKNTGEVVEKTEWIRATAWRKLAEICGEYLHKGSKVYIEGKMQTRKWQDEGGNDRYTTEIQMNNMLMLDSKGSGGSSSGGSSRGTASQQSSGGNQQQAPAGGFDDFDDDIPF